MANEFLIALQRDQATRNRLEGKSGAFSDYVGNLLETQNREAEKSEALDRERAQEFARQQERQQDRQDAIEREEREESRLDDEARALELGGQIYRDLIRKLSWLTDQTAIISKTRDTPWSQVVEIGCSIRCAERLLDLFSCSDGTLVLRFAELHRTVDLLADKYSDLPKLDGQFEVGRELIGLVANANSVTTRNFMSSSHLFFNDRFLAKGKQKPVSPEALRNQIINEWPKDCEKLREAVRPLADAMPRALSLGLVSIDSHGAAIPSPWLLDMIFLQVHTDCSDESESFVNGQVELMKKVLTSNADVSASNECLESLIGNAKARYVPYVSEVAEQAQIINSSISDPTDLKSALEIRAYDVEKFHLFYDSPPTGLRGILYQLNGTKKRIDQKVQAFAARAAQLSASLSAAFEGFDPRSFRLSAANTTEKSSSRAVVRVERTPPELLSPHPESLALATVVESLPPPPRTGAGMPTRAITALVLFAIAGGGAFLMREPRSTAETSRASLAPTGAIPATQGGVASAVGATAPMAQTLSPEHSAPSDQISSANAQALSTVRAFYDALSRGSGEDASKLVVPEKRAAGPYAAESITRFYGSLTEPLQVIDAESNDDGTTLVRYRFVAGRRLCQGRAIVTTVAAQGTVLIQRIRPLDGC
jgi:hypothetical protein